MNAIPEGAFRPGALRAGYGARNMAVVRRFAIDAVRLGKGKRSIQSTRKLAG